MGSLLDQDRAQRLDCIKALERHGFHETARLELEALLALDTAKLAMPPGGPRDRQASDAGVYYRPVAPGMVGEDGCEHLCEGCLPGGVGSVEYRAACCRPIHRSDLALRCGPGPLEGHLRRVQPGARDP